MSPRNLQLNRKLFAESKFLAPIVTMSRISLRNEVDCGPEINF